MAKVLLERLEIKVLAKPVDADEEELRDDFFECMFLVRQSSEFTLPPNTAMQKRIVTLGISGGRASTRPFRHTRPIPSPGF
jgi:hypothetical protein